MSEVESAGMILGLFAIFGFSFAIYVVIALFLDERAHAKASAKEEENLIATDKIIHCWEDHPDAPLECICSGGEKKKGDPCVLNRH